jgi:hypothetical protein
MHFKHFNHINYVRGIGPSPARVNRKTGELQINLDVWPRLKEEHKKFVLLHEEGHRALNTSDELAVDEYAFKKYADSGLSLKEGVKALTQVLSGRSPQHGLRAQLQLQRAKQYDYYVNKNEGAIQPNYHSTQTLNQSNMLDTFLDDIQDGVESSYNGTDDFLGIAIGKKAKAKKAARVEKSQERKADRHAARMDRKSARAENIRSKASSRSTLAAQGIVMPGASDVVKNIGQALGPIAGIAGNLATGGMLGSVGGLLGGGSSPIQDQVGGAIQQQTSDAASVYQQLPYATPPYYEVASDNPPKNYTDDGSKKKMLMIGGGVAVVIIIILVAVFASRKKSK